MMRSILAITLTMLLILQIAAAYAQPNFTFKEVRGEYRNDELGIEITLPRGWSGMEMPQIMLGPMMHGGFVVVPNGIDMSNMDKMFEQPMMMLMVSIHEKPDVTQRFKMGDQGEPEQGKPEGVKPDCKILSFSLVNRGGANGIEVVVECDTEEGKFRAKYLMLSQMKDDKIRNIQLAFVARVDEYDKYIKDFDDSLNTLKVSNVRDFTLQLNKVQERVRIKDSEVTVDIKSNSIVKDFRFDEKEKSLRFMVEGDDGTLGNLEITISRLLTGPYIVTIDGEPITPIEVEDPETGEITLKIYYTHSIREIKISGTEVVPEFPIAVLPILALITGVAIFMSRSIRSKLF